MDRRHLRTEDGVVLAHLLREDDAVVIRRNDGAPRLLLLTDTDRRDQGTDTDACRTEVVDLIDF